MSKPSKIGTVEILRERIYNLDAETHSDAATTVIVPAGTYELFGDGMTTFWMMRGQLNNRGFRRLGDGMFAMQGHDEGSGIEVVFPSRRFGPDEWAALLAGPECVDGPAQRLRVVVAEAATS